MVNITDFLWVLLEHAANLYQGFLCVYFVYKFLGSKPQKKFFSPVNIYFSLAIAVIISIFNAITPFEDLAILIYFVILFVYAVVACKGGIFKKLLASIVPIALMLIVTSLFTSSFSAISKMSLEELIITQSSYRLIMLVLLQVLLLYVFKIVLSGLQKEEIRLNRSEWVLIAFVFTVSIFIGVFLNLIHLNADVDTEEKLYIVFSVAGLFAINITTYYMVVKLSANNNALKQVELLELNRNYQQQYIDNIGLQYETIKKIRHDINNNYGVIYMLLKEEKIEDAKSFIKENIDAVENIDFMMKTSNQIINAIINAKSTEAKTLGIKVVCMSVSEFDGVSDLDLCNLLGNMFDNAIRACIQAENENKYIELKIIKEDRYYTISMKNTVGGDFKQLKSPVLPETTKKDKENHGYGLKIVKDIAEKYNGLSDFYVQDEYFYNVVMLFMNTADKAS